MKKIIKALSYSLILFLAIHSQDSYAGFGFIDDMGSKLSELQNGIGDYLKPIGAVIIFVAILFMGFNIIKNRNNAEERVATMMGGPYIIGGAILLGLILVVVGILKPYIDRTPNLTADGNSIGVEVVYFSQRSGVTKTTMQWLIIKQTDSPIMDDNFMDEVLNKYNIDIVKSAILNNISDSEMDEFFANPEQPELTINRLKKYVKSRYDTFHGLNGIPQEIGLSKVENWGSLVAKSKSEIQSILLEVYKEELDKSNLTKFLSYFK